MSYTFLLKKTVLLVPPTLLVPVPSSNHYLVRGFLWQRKTEEWLNLIAVFELSTKTQWWHTVEVVQKGCSWSHWCQLEFQEQCDIVVRVLEYGTQVYVPIHPWSLVGEFEPVTSSSLIYLGKSWPMFTALISLERGQDKNVIPRTRRGFSCAYIRCKSLDWILGY